MVRAGRGRLKVASAAYLDHSYLASIRAGVRSPVTSFAEDRERSEGACEGFVRGGVNPDGHPPEEFVTAGSRIRKFEPVIGVQRRLVTSGDTSPGVELCITFCSTPL